MKILGLGIDIIEIDRIQKAVEKNDRFLDRFFSEKECEFFKKKGYKYNTIAGNFCAKESFSKAIGTGVRGFNLKDVEILRDELGAPFLSINEKMKKIFEEFKIYEVKISISHSKDYAVANCLILSKLE